VGGTMPEDLPLPDKSIPQLKKEKLAELKNPKKQKLITDEGEFDKKRSSEK